MKVLPLIAALIFTKNVQAFVISTEKRSALRQPGVLKTIHRHKASSVIFSASVEQGTPKDHRLSQKSITPTSKSDAQVKHCPTPQNEIDGVKLTKCLPSQNWSIKQWWRKGSNVHSSYAFISVVFAFFLYSKESINPLCKLSLLNNYIGQVADNTVKAAGSAIGESATLRRLSKICLILHGFGVPMVALPLTEIATRHGLFDLRTRQLFNTVWLAFSFAELVQWTLFDSRAMEVIDTRSMRSHQGQTLAGILSYSSGKILQCILPVLAVVLYQLGISVAMIMSRRSICGGGLLLVSALVSILSSSVNRPDIQLLGETMFIGSIYSVLAASV